jgi:hypothetical protein
MVLGSTGYGDLRDPDAVKNFAVVNDDDITPGYGHCTFKELYQK